MGRFTQTRKAYDALVEALTFKQYSAGMGILNMKARALFVRDHVTQSKKIHALCNAVIAAYDSESLKAVSNE